MSDVLHSMNAPAAEYQHITHTQQSVVPTYNQITAFYNLFMSTSTSIMCVRLGHARVPAQSDYANDMPLAM